MTTRKRLVALWLVIPLLVIGVVRAVDTNGPDTGYAYNGARILPVKYASIDAASSGNNTVIAAVSGKKLRVLSYTLVAVGTAVNVYMQDGGSTAKLGSSSHPIVLDKTGATGPGGISSSFAQGLFETASGQSLILNLSTTQAVVGLLTYVEVDATQSGVN